MPVWSSYYFSVFLLNCKIRHASASWKELIRKSLCLPIFRNITEIVETIKCLYGFGGTLSQNYRRLYGSLTMFQES